MVKDNGIEVLLDDLASRKPTPSGGSAAAVMGAMGAALVSMVCNLTIGKTQYRDFEEELKSVLTKAEELRRDLTKMIEEDVQAFDAVMRAYGMPRLTKDEMATRAQAIQTALKTDARQDCGVEKEGHVDGWHAVTRSRVPRIGCVSLNIASSETTHLIRRR